MVHISTYCVPAPSTANPHPFYPLMCVYVHVCSISLEPILREHEKFTIWHLQLMCAHKFYRSIPVVHLKF